MLDKQSDFKKTLRLEIAFIIFLITTLALYTGDVIPKILEVWVIGFAGVLGLIPLARSAWASIRERQINVDLLATIALFFSIVSQEWGSMLFINLMLSSARVLGLYTKRRTERSLESLMKLKPSKARVLRNEHATEIPLSEVRPGDLIVVNLGEQIPVDGKVFKGAGTINQASLTGESVPVLREVGDQVLSATVVVSGNIIIQTERIGTETTFEKMIKLVEASHEAKTRMRTLAERFASWYIGIMLLVAIIVYGVTRDTSLVLAVVLVVCADDIAIAIPLAYIASIGAAARRGIIVKGADFLEGVTKITTLIVDKTGTLTMGNLAVKNMHTFHGFSQDELLKLSGMVCQKSTHPISKAILAYIKKQDIIPIEPDHIKEKEGRGIYGEKDGNRIVVGRLEFMDEHGIPTDSTTHDILSEEETRGNNATLVAVNDKIIGMFALADELRAETHQAITNLKQSGVKEIVMLTGDNEGVARSIAERLGIDKYYARLLPEHKVFILEDYLKNKRRTVAMVGDGVNDAAVLTRSDVGIAMGGIGSDAAIESADVVLMQDDFRKIVELREISQKVIAVAYQNFTIWGVVNAIGLYFVFTGTFDPSRAALYNFLTDFIPIANALRLFNYQGKKIQ